MTRQRWLSGFTLIELLVVIAIIAVISSLALPSLQGLFGVVGRRSGANTVAGAVELARLEAIKHGVPAFVGFAAMTNDEAFSSIIVYRGLRADEAVTNTNTVMAASRWLRFPRGVFVDPSTLDGAATSPQTVSGATFPRLGNTTVTNVRGIRFDRFGKLAAATPAVLRVGEGVLSGAELTFIPTPDNFYELSIEPLTGKVVVTDGTAKSP